MTVTRTAVGRLAWKEGRALLPVWLACVVATAFAALPVARPSFGHPLSVFVRFAMVARGLTALGFTVGALTLGALSMGHEFHSDSIGIMLGLPVPRRLALAVKFVTLAIALVGLGIVGYLAALRPMFNPFLSLRFGTEGLLVPLLCGLTLAPVLTLLSGSLIGGALLAGAVPVVFLLVGETIGQLIYGYTGSSTFMMEELGRNVLWRGLLAACTVGVIWTVRAFDRLEWTGGRSARASRLAGEVWLLGRSPADADAHGARLFGWTHRPTVQLVVKDLRLQAVTVVLVALYVVTWTFVLAVHQRWPLLGPDSDVISGFYIALLPLLAGAMAFAPERSLGTQSFRAALPIPAWWQWAMKVGLAEAIALGLGLGLAALLGRGDSLSFFRGDNLRILAVSVALTTVVSLHTSSFSSSGPRALLMAIPSAIAALIGFEFVGSPVSRWAVSELFAHVSRQPEMRVEVARRISDWITQEAVGQNLSLFALVAAAAVVPLRFSYLNFTSDEQRSLHAWRQVAWIVAATAALAVLVSVGLALLRFL